MVVENLDEKSSTFELLDLYKSLLEEEHSRNIEKLLLEKRIVEIQNKPRYSVEIKRNAKGVIQVEVGVSGAESPVEAVDKAIQMFRDAEEGITKNGGELDEKRREA